MMLRDQGVGGFIGCLQGLPKPRVNNHMLPLACGSSIIEGVLY